MFRLAMSAILIRSYLCVSWTVDPIFSSCPGWLMSRSSFCTHAGVCRKGSTGVHALGYHVRGQASPSCSCLRCFTDLERMRDLQLVLLLLILRPLAGSANFHVVNMYYGFNNDVGFDYQMVIPSAKWGCEGIPRDTIAGGRYPDCNGGYDLHVPGNTCNYSGVTIRPACSGVYFGKLLDKDGRDLGDCYWHDAGEVSAFTCKLNLSNSNYQIVYDRLLCSTKMCAVS